MPYKVIVSGGDISIEFAGVVRLHVHAPADEVTRQQVMGMIAGAPDQKNPYAMMAAICHEPVTAIGTETLHRQLG